jgi:hypothetical protein
MTLIYAFATALLATVGGVSVASAQTARWPEQKANAWYARQPWSRPSEAILDEWSGMQLASAHDLGI